MTDSESAKEPETEKVEAIEKPKSDPKATKDNLIEKQAKPETN
jgi:hypothetical protein